MIQEILRSIGLSKNEIKIYLVLLEQGSSLIGQICAKTKIHRRNVYDSIEMLKDKGFISSTIVNNKTIFEAINPKRIIDILDEKKTDIQLILPKLLSNQNKKQPSVKVYTGLNGRKIIFEAKLKYKEEQYVLGAHKPSDKSALFIENYHKRRINKKIQLKMLFLKNSLEAAKKFNRYKYVQARVLPSKFNSPIAVNVYGNKTAILLGSGYIEPISVLIEDQNLADNFKNYFNLLWSLSEPIK